MARASRSSVGISRAARAQVRADRGATRATWAWRRSASMWARSAPTSAATANRRTPMASPASDLLHRDLGVDERHVGPLPDDQVALGRDEGVDQGQGQAADGPADQEPAARPARARRRTARSRPPATASSTSGSSVEKARTIAPRPSTHEGPGRAAPGGHGPRPPGAQDRAVAVHGHGVGQAQDPGVAPRRPRRPRPRRCASRPATTIRAPSSGDAPVGTAATSAARAGDGLAGSAVGPDAPRCARPRSSTVSPAASGSASARAPGRVAARQVVAGARPSPARPRRR